MTKDDGRGHSYPLDHWRELSRFAEGDELDPKGAFLLSADTWDARAYCKDYLPSNAGACRSRFSNLHSFLKLYVKRYCYYELIGRSEFLKVNVRLSGSLSRADRYISEHGYQSLDDLALPHVFDAVWASLLMNHDQGGIQDGLFPVSVIKLQERTRPFWVDLNIHFGSPLYVPPVAPHNRRTPLEIGLDRSKLIPDAVLRQLMNILALHRDGISSLSRGDHLRLCVLLLLICLGRRVREVLSAPRGEGEDGPLVRYPCRGSDGEQGDALWFIMRPSKGGPSEYVYISPAWENLATYCVRQLIKYGDEVRQFATPEERHLLILISGRNGTASTRSKSGSVCEVDFYSAMEPADTTRSHEGRDKKTTGLSYGNFCYWLNGSVNRGKNTPGVLERWGVTADGSAEGTTYRLQTHFGRHSRQSAIAADAQVSLITRQRDLNHRHADMQFAYQHVVEEQNEVIMSKVTRSPLPGQDNTWLTEVFGIGAGDEGSGGKSTYRQGLVQLLSPRWRQLLENSPSFTKPNHRPLGACEEPEGCLPTRGEKKGRFQNSSASANNSKAMQETVTGRSQHQEKNNGSSIAAQPAATSTVAVETADVLRGMRERLKRLEENGGGEAI